MSLTDTLTIRQFAQRLSVDRSTVWRWIRDRQLPHYRIGHVVRIPLDQAEAWLERYRQNPDGWWSENPPRIGRTRRSS